MFVFLSYISVIIPIVLVAIFYIIIKDKFQKNQKKLLWLSFLLGIGGFLITDFILRRLLFFLIYSLLQKLGIRLGIVYIFLFLNELMKYCIIIIFIYKKEEFSKLFDGIAYSVIISMGYIAANSLMLLMRFPYFKDVISIIFAVPVSAASAVIMGYFIGREKFQEKKHKELHLFGIGGAIIIQVMFYSISCSL